MEALALEVAWLANHLSQETRENLILRNDFGLVLGVKAFGGQALWSRPRIYHSLFTTNRRQVSPFQQPTTNGFIRRLAIKLLRPMRRLLDLVKSIFDAVAHAFI